MSDDQSIDQCLQYAHSVDSARHSPDRGPVQAPAEGDVEEELYFIDEPAPSTSRTDLSARVYQVWDN